MLSNIVGWRNHWRCLLNHMIELRVDRNTLLTNVVRLCTNIRNILSSDLSELWTSDHTRITVFQ